MELTPFIRKPFKVEATQVTRENIQEIAEHVGAVRYNEETGEPYIKIDRKIVPNLYQVPLGFWLTKMGNQYRFFSEKIFHDQFTSVSSETEVAFLTFNGNTSRSEVTNA